MGESRDTRIRVRPYRIVGARSVGSLLITCEHASSSVPRALRGGAAMGSLLASHWASDIGAWDIARRVANLLGASAIGGLRSRLVIDLNRAVGDPTLVVSSAGGLDLPWNRALEPLEIERRIVGLHLPYHGEIERLIARRLVRGVRPLLLSIHTFTPELDGAVRCYDAGVLFVDHERAARRLGRGLAAAGLSVRYNEPYSGLEGLMYAIHRHGSHHGLPCLELELSQASTAVAGRRGQLASVVAAAVADLLSR